MAQRKVKVYFDHNATTPLFSDVKREVVRQLAYWGNPSSIHWAGREPKQLLRNSRRLLALALAVDPLEIVFTSGGTESNNQAIMSAFEWAKKNNKNRFICSSVEHSSVSKVFDFIESKGFEVFRVPVSREGVFDFDYFSQCLNEKTALVSVMFANNETGVLFPIKKITQMAHRYGALVHSDMVQGLGKIPLAIQGLNIDFASFSAHKFYSPKGVGALYIKKGTPLVSLIHGGGQERRRRGGTENTLGLAGFSVMLSKLSCFDDQLQKVEKLRNRLEELVLKEFPFVVIVGNKTKRIGNTSLLLFPEYNGEMLLMNLDLHGFAVSTGAACGSGHSEPSPVLSAMGYSRKEASSSLRVSLGWENTEDEVHYFISSLKEILKRLKKINELSVPVKINQSIEKMI